MNKMKKVLFTGIILLLSASLSAEEVMMFTANQYFTSRIYTLSTNGTVQNYFQYDNYHFCDMAVVNNELYVAEAFAPRVLKVNLETGELDVIIDDWSLYYFYDLAFDGTYFYVTEWDLNRYDINGNKNGTASFSDDVYGSAWDGEYLWMLNDNAQIKCWDVALWPNLIEVTTNAFSPPSSACRGLWFDGNYFWSTEGLDGSLGYIYQFDYSGQVIDQIAAPAWVGFGVCKLDQVVAVDDPHQNNISKLTVSPNPFINNISKRASGEDWAKMGVKEKKALINQIGAKSKTGMLTSQILNQISGTAVSDQEFERIMGILTGGDIDTTNPRLIAEALRGSGETIGDMAKSDIQGIRSKYSPYDKMELAKLYKAGNIRPIGEKITGGDQTSMETAMKTIDKETQAASDLGVTAWDQITGKADPIDPTARNESSAWNFLSNVGSDAKNYVSNLFSGGDDKSSPDPVNPSRAKYEAMDMAELKALIKSKSLSPEDRKLALEIAAGKYRKQRGI